MTIKSSIITSKGDFEMKRKTLFMILCIALFSAGAIGYAALVQHYSTSILSNQELAQISGTADCCYEQDEDGCRWYGDAECTTGNCPASENDYYDYWYTSTIGGEKNDKESYFYGSVPCYAQRSIEDDGWEAYAYCTTSPPTGYDPDEWGGFWFWCKWDALEDCHKCVWGDEIGPPVYRAEYKCRPI
jgi:hypothetical protein